MAALTVAYFALPGWHMVLWGAIGVSSAVTAGIGALRNRPRRMLPWWLISVAILTFVSGDTVYNVLTDVLGEDNPFPSVADVLYLATFPLLAVGLLGLARSGAAGRDRASLLDALTLTFGLGLLSWIFLIEPHIRDPALTAVQRMTSVAYPVGDVLLLATVARLLAAARRTPTVALMAAGAVGLLVSDVLYGLLQLDGSWQVGSAADLGWVLFYIAWGAAALHPSMVVLTQPRPVRDGEVSRRRLVLLTLSSLIAPATLLIEAVRGRITDGPMIAILSAVLFLAVLARLAGVGETHRQAVARERALREAGATLVSATDVDGVVTTVRAGVANLIPAGADHRVVVSVYGPADAHPVPVPAIATLVPRLDLEPHLAAALGYFDTVLRCPLTVPDRRSGDPRIGMLFIAATDAVLVALPSAMEVLAAQAALALERIYLTTEISRRDSEAYFRTLVHHAADVILIVDDSGRIRYASPSAVTLFGGPLHPGATLDELIHTADGSPVSQSLRLARSGESRTDSVDRTVRRADGSQVQVEASYRDLRRDPTVRGLVITLRDVTAQRSLESELTHQAFHDSLTGLANRILFQDRLRQAVARTERTGAVVGVLFIDLDDFKIVNDTIGHEAGDQLLVGVGQRLVGCLRPHDTVARLGGDEFAALIDDALDPTEVEDLAERISRALAEPFPLGDGLVSGAASIGVATTAEGAGGEELLRQADLALYVAKGAGKGQWRRYQAALHTAVLERLELRAALDQSVADNSFTLRYQPIVQLATAAAIGFEALVRWNHPTRGLVSPGEFIEVAEESGLIIPIGAWVLRSAMTDAVRWRDSRPAAIAPYLSVNVSARQFRTPGFVEQVQRDLAETGLPPTALMLEITESLLLRDDEQVWADLAALRDIGVRVAIDDFGTGYSSLSYLRHVPIDVLKIDRSFIDTMTSSPQQRALVDGIVRLAHTLGLQVIAEGVEEPAERDLLLDMGCPFGQGYLFALPLSYGEASKWIYADQLGGVGGPNGRRVRVQDAGEPLG
jgi:diguanylate cyclase (GGDEF)-like protein/PAS domain S-box-containing protein